MRTIEGGIATPKGFKATGKHIGIKKKKKDLCLIYSEMPANVAAAFTKNIVQAAPVLWCKKIVESKNKVRGIVINSGNANACTGNLGYQHTEIMAKTFADCLNIKPEEVLVSSTGVIGLPLPIETITKGIQENYKELNNDIKASKAAAKAILTTDTFQKEIAVELEIDNKTVTIAGIAKGSGMIHPNMATMLAFITTDLNISQELLDKALKEIINDTYNMISVDGDTSTNDMVAVMANAEAKNTEITKEDEDYKKFYHALHYVNAYLAQQIIRDGEGATKFLEVKINGASSKTTAQMLGKSIISSNLVKTAFFGNDANWGRILAAMGYSGAEFNPDGVTIQFSSSKGLIDLMQTGKPIIFDEAKALEILKEKDIQILINLADGNHSAKAWGCDLSYEYVKINGEYRT